VSDQAPRFRPLPILLSVCAIAAFVLLTNSGFTQRIALLIEQGRLGTIVGYVGVWGLSGLALLAVAFQPSLLIRAIWAALIALTAAVGFAFHLASGNEFTVFDVISLWNARHEAGRAADFYQRDIYWFALALLGGFVALMLAPRIPALARRRWSGALALMPLVPILAMAAIIVVKEGGGSEGLPVQFQPLAVAGVAGGALAANPLADRKDVAWEPTGAKVKKIVFLVDESVRGDYIDWTPDNPYTPELARLKPEIVDFGHAASGGNCSHYSNSILRFGPARSEIGRDMLTLPTIWQYAKKAGYRTVYIDGQAAFNRNPGKMQNFMTTEEAKSIDSFRPLPEDVTAPDLDDRLLDIIETELKGNGPVFIYANKNGAHFPYDNAYATDKAKFHPTMSETEGDTSEGRINSFRNAIAWTVDRIFKRLFAEADLKDTVIIYTSDHGQQFNPGHLSHCTVEDPDPREGLVPLFAITPDAALKQRFTEAAEGSMGHASHFAIAPTLYELMGYRPVDIATRYKESMFSPDREQPAFTTGDIFGLFGNDTRWHPLDLTKNYLESGK
jgi:lipid A ethanolaminephosphotransferase